MNELIPALFVVVVLAGPQLAMARRVGGDEAGLVAGAVVAHILSAIAMVLVVRDYYGYGDMLAYWRGGARLAAMIDADGSRIDDVVRLIFQQPNTLQVLGNGWSTGSMHGISALLAWLLDDSLYAMCLVVSLTGCASRMWLFASLRPSLPPSSSRMLAVACLLIPSVVFWTSGVLKEGVATPAMTFAAGAVVRMLAGRMRLERGVVVVAVAVVVVGLTKAYVLFPFAAACVAGALARRAIRAEGRVRVRPGRLILGGALALALVVALGQVFPKYSLERFADTAEDLRALGETHAGGSTTNVGVGGGAAGLAVVGLVTALFRPVIFEVKNPLMLISALEMSVFLFLAVRIGARHRGAVVTALERSWLFVLAVVFVACFALAVGIATPNLGTLARYRVPMLPFFGLTFVILEVVVRKQARSSRDVGARR